MELPIDFFLTFVKLRKMVWQAIIRFPAFFVFPELDKLWI